MVKFGVRKIRVSNIGVIDWAVACYTFSTPCIDLTKSVGLNMTATAIAVA